MFFMQKKEHCSKNYPYYPFLSGALKNYQNRHLLTLKAPFTTAADDIHKYYFIADDIHEYFFIVFQRK